MRLDEPPRMRAWPGGVRVALRRLDTDNGVRVLGWLIAVVMVVSVVVLIGRGGSSPADPSLEGSGSDVPPASGRIAGFGEARLRATAGAATRDLCVAVASTDAARRQGMMGRTDFAGYDGMLFVFGSDSTSAFYMRATPLPLSIAWFDARGRFVGAADMDPCPDRAGCPTFDPGRSYRFALEVDRGHLTTLGVGPGATVSLAGSC